MSLVHIVLILIAIGVGLYCVNRFVLMDKKIKTVINIVVVLATVAWLLNVFGVFAYLSHIKVGKLR